jgi:PAS domain S-box-containing protein
MAEGPGSNAERAAAELEEARRLIAALEAAAAIEAAERKRVEGELRASEVRFRALVEQAPIGIYLTDADGDCSFVNARWSEMAGLSQDEALGQGWLQAVHPDDRAAIGERWYRAAQSGGVWGFEYRFRDRDGKDTWVFGTAAPLRDIQGKTVGHVGVNTDIGARRESEEALRESEEKYRSVVERASDGIIIARPGGILFANEAFAAMSGYSRAELAALPLLDLIRPEQRASIAERAQRRLAGEDVPATYEIDLVSKGGDLFAVEVRADVIIHGGAPADLVIMRDVTERRRAERELRASESMRSAAEEAAHVGSWRLELASQRVSWSPEMYRLFDVTPDGGDGDFDKVMPDRVHPDDRAAVDAATTRALETGETGPIEYRVVWSDGSEHILHGDGGLERDSAGEPVALVGYYQDVTSQRRAETEIRRLNAELEERVVSRTEQLDATTRELEALAYSIAHDVRAPLRTIDGFSAMVLEDERERLSPEGAAALLRVRVAAQTLSRRLDELMGLSNVSRRDLLRQTVDVSALAVRVGEEVAAESPSRSVELTVTPGLSADADPALLRLVLRELLGNAWKFTRRREEAHVEVGARDLEDARAFYVRDDGAGFDMRYAEHLFGAFQRMHTPGEFEGVGIGLATVQRLVRRHGGRCWAEAEVEKGATIYFTLPAPTPEG